MSWDDRARRVVRREPRGMFLQTWTDLNVTQVHLRRGWFSVQHVTPIARLANERVIEYSGFQRGYRRGCIAVRSCDCIVSRPHCESTQQSRQSPSQSCQGSSTNTPWTWSQEAFAACADCTGNWFAIMALFQAHARMHINKRPMSTAHARQKYLPPTCAGLGGACVRVVTGLGLGLRTGARETTWR